MYPDAYDRTQRYSVPPEPEILSFLARLREEPESDEGSSPDEGVPSKMSGHLGKGHPMKIGVGYVQRDFCDGQSLASPGRWPPGARVHPSTSAWTAVRDCFWKFTSHHGTERLLVELAMGKIQSSPFPPAEVAELKQQVIHAAARSGYQIVRRAGDRTDVPIDYRFLDQDPEVGLGDTGCQSRT